MEVALQDIGHVHIAQSLGPAKPKSSSFSRQLSSTEGCAMIIALLNQKGEVGKTTLATHIAGDLAMRGQQVILLDADPKGSSLDWTQRRDRKSTRLNSSHIQKSRMPSSA